MASIDTVKNELGINPLAGTELSNTAGDSSVDLGQNFAGLMALLTNSADESAADNNSAVLNLDSDAMLKRMQGNLLSALGLTNLNEDSIAQLTSASSLSTMQSSLLSSLQASLFNPAPVTSETETTKLAADTEIAGSLEASLQDIYHYAFGQEGACINNVFDAVNPLNHIPVIADEYQKASSTTVSPISDIIGGYAFGGPIGMGLAAVNLAVESVTGKSIYNNVKDYLLNDSQQAVVDSATTKIEQNLERANKAHHFVTRAI